MIKHGTGSLETRFRRKDGSAIDVLLSSSSIKPGDFEKGLVFTVIDISEIKVAERERTLYAQRLEALIKIGQMFDVSLSELVAFAMEEAVRLTDSSIGYVAFMNEDESILTMHAWSQEAMRQCAVKDQTLTYPIAETGLWGEAVRQRPPDRHKRL